MGTTEPMGDPGRPELRMIRREESEWLHEELARLPEKYRLPVVLCDLGGLAHAEAARRLNWPSGSLSVRLMRARELLRGRLTRRGLTPTLALLAIATLPETARMTVSAAMAERTVQTALASLPNLGTLASGAENPGAVALADQVMSAVARTKLVAVSLALTGGILALVVLLSWLPVLRKGGVGSRGGSAVAETEARPTAPALKRPESAPTGHAEAEQVARESTSGVAGSPGRVVVAPVAAALPGEELASYEALVKQLGRDAGSQVRLALWCEANGLVAERLKHLVLAVMTDPNQPAARGLLGQVAFRGHWRRPEDVGSLLKGDTRFAAARAGYETRRQALEEDDNDRDSAEAHWRLALWCEQHGLESEARAHFVAVTRRDPARDAPWRRLGYRKSRGRWLKPEQIAAEASALAARRTADHFWMPRLSRWKAALQDDAKRPKTEAELAGVTDPLAVPAIWANFAQGGPAGQVLAARLLGQVEGPDASRGLAYLAVLGHSAEVRRIATEILAPRDPRDVVGLLINFLVDPIKYEVRAVQGPGLPGVLFVEGAEFNLRRFYTVPPLPDSTIRRLLDPTTPPDYTRSTAAVLGDDWARLVVAPVMGQVTRNNVKGVRQNIAVALRAAEVAQQRLEADAQVIVEHNRAVSESNARIEVPLRALTGQDYGADRESWRAWWTDQQGYAYVPLRTSESTPKPTVEQEIPLPYVPRYRTLTGMSCFGAGTLVRTRQGERPIETIRIGDAVLTQDTRSGALSFAPVLAVFRNKPAPTLQIYLGGLGEEPIVATGIHRFWVVGKGWAMARDLVPGDRVRTLGDQARVAAVSEGPSQPVFNLEVGENQSFFVGQAGALVHDNSLVEPVIQPFDELVDSRPLASDW